MATTDVEIGYAGYVFLLFQAKSEPAKKCFKPTASQPPPQCDNGFTRRCKALWMFHKQHALTIWSPALRLLKA
eukprot:s374_g23.t1